MKKHKFLLSILSLSLFIPSTIYADCTKEEIDNFKEIEDEYKITYEFDKDTKTYTLTFYSPEPDMYDFDVVDSDVFNNYSLVDYNTAKCDKIKPGTYNFVIVGLSENCNNTLKKIKIELPKYNKYSEDPLCEGIEEFVLCQPTYDKDIEYDTFVSRVNTYKNNHKVKENNDNKEEKKEQNKILQYIQDNLLQIIIITIFIIMVITTIILTAKSIKKSRRLE